MAFFWNAKIMRNHINMKYLCFADDKRIPPGQCSMPLQDVSTSGLDAALRLYHHLRVVRTSLWYYVKVEVFIFSVSWNVRLVCLNWVLCSIVMRLFRISCHACLQSLYRVSLSPAVAVFHGGAKGCSVVCTVQLV